MSNQTVPHLWNIPYPRNPFFTGREELLSRLRDQLQAGQAMALSQPQAISGLGGIGKTQLALEYAYRFRTDYQAVLWAQADTRENLTSSYLAIATLLNLPEKSEQESARVITAVKNWLQRNTSWLLILDNADDLALARDFLPPTFGGHVLLTTRAQATGRFAHRLEVDILSTELGALFLLHRAGLLPADATLEHAPEEERNQARAICEELGGLPLALDQAGAYIEEVQCTLSDYYHLYRTQRAALLQRRGGVVEDHPASVATTWMLSFKKVEQADPAAADVLRLCAFLQADAIPEEILQEGASQVIPSLATFSNDPLTFNQAIRVLLSYSLIRRNPEARQVSIHRLIQVVLKDAMGQTTYLWWARATVQTINTILPEVEHNPWTWELYKRCLIHTLGCISLIDELHLTGLAARRLLLQTGRYLVEHARYTEAEPLYLRALRIQEQIWGPENSHMAVSLNRLANLYCNQEKYELVEPLHQRALHIQEQIWGAKHHSTAYTLNGLAILYLKQGKYEQAERLYQQALTIREQTLGSEHPSLTFLLTNLANLYCRQEKYELAERLYQRALTIGEQTLGPENHLVAFSLDGLANLYHAQGKYSQAEPLYVRALAIREQQLGAQHYRTAISLSNLANLYSNQGKYAQAELLYVRALTIDERVLGPQHPHTRSIRANYARLLRTMGRDTEAAALDQP